MLELKARNLFKSLKYSSIFDVEKAIPPEYAIPSLERMLKRSGLLIRTSDKQDSWKEFLFKWFLILLLFSHAITLAFASQIDVRQEENRHWIFILGDITFIMMGIREVYLISVIMMSIGAIYLIYIFCFKRYFEWMEVFHFLEGKYSPLEMGITDIEMVKELIARTKIIIMAKDNAISGALIGASVLTLYEVSVQTRDRQELLYCILWYPYYLAIFYLICITFGMAFLCFYIVCFYFSYKTSLYNKRLIRVLNDTLFIRKFVRQVEMKLLIREHNLICRNILTYNNFFSRLYTCMIFIGLPMNVIMLNLLLFTELSQLEIYIYVFSFVITGTYIFWLGYIMAVVHGEVKKTYKKLCKLQWKFNNIKPTTKIKVKCSHKIIILN
jgi:hypothetical protein